MDWAIVLRLRVVISGVALMLACNHDDCVRLDTGVPEIMREGVTALHDVSQDGAAVIESEQHLSSPGATWTLAIDDAGIWDAHLIGDDLAIRDNVSGSTGELLGLSPSDGGLIDLAEVSLSASWWTSASVEGTPAIAWHYISAGSDSNPSGRFLVAGDTEPRKLKLSTEFAIADGPWPLMLLEFDRAPATVLARFSTLSSSLEKTEKTRWLFPATRPTHGLIQRITESHSLAVTWDSSGGGVWRIDTASELIAMFDDTAHGPITLADLRCAGGSCWVLVSRESAMELTRFSATRSGQPAVTILADSPVGRLGPVTETGAALFFFASTGQLSRTNVSCTDRGIR